MGIRIHAAVLTAFFVFGMPLMGIADTRDKAIKEYLSEFCTPLFIQGMPNISIAIQEVLRRMPYRDFLKITDRRRPVMFTEVYDSGTAKFAGSSEIIVEKGEAPCCQEGFTIIKLSVALEGAQSPTAIEGVIAHELAHRVLDHVKNGNVGCSAEREANALIKKWGFKKEFEEAGKAFGRREGDPVSCQENTKGPKGID